MRSDAERWRFLADNELALGRSADGCTVAYYQPADRKGGPANFITVASAPTADAAIDAAITRWERKHRRRWTIDR